jgi:hypothetical protein
LHFAALLGKEVSVGAGNRVKPQRVLLKQREAVAAKEDGDPFELTTNFLGGGAVIVSALMDLLAVFTRHNDVNRLVTLLTKLVAKVTRLRVNIQRDLLEADDIWLTAGNFVEDMASAKPCVQEDRIAVWIPVS